VTSNLFAIRGINFTDTHNFLGSSQNKMENYAKNSNLTIFYKEGLLDFAKTFSAGESGYKYYNGRRTYRAYTLLTNATL
jgi:hypothetical protein